MIVAALALLAVFMVMVVMLMIVAALALLIVVVMMVIMVMAAAALLAVLVMVVMALSYFLKKLLCHIVRRFFDNRKELRARKLAARRRHDGCLRVLLPD